MDNTKNKDQGSSDDLKKENQQLKEQLIKANSFVALHAADLSMVRQELKNLHVENLQLQIACINLSTQLEHAKQKYERLQGEHAAKMDFFNMLLKKPDP